MVTLLIHMLRYQPDYPVMPLVTKAQQIYGEAVRVAAQVKGTIDRERAEL